mmetsp:Transcript_104850/g.186504  ORF Transcript_104850/g.186504 Transcript_104850/m.186504 type:complete len:200 (-) Transcript_104850:229-828(-)
MTLLVDQTSECCAGARWLACSWMPPLIQTSCLATKSRMKPSLEEPLGMMISQSFTARTACMHLSCHLTSSSRCKIVFQVRITTSWLVELLTRAKESSLRSWGHAGHCQKHQRQQILWRSITSTTRLAVSTSGFHSTLAHRSLKFMRSLTAQLAPSPWKNSMNQDKLRLTLLASNCRPGHLTSWPFAPWEICQTVRGNQA